MGASVHTLNPNKRLRKSARIIVLDPEHRVLMFRFNIEGREPFWVTVGGECDAHETFEDAARRELLEETGIAAEPGDQIARTTPEFITPDGEDVQADERYFIVRVDRVQIDTAGHTALEQKVMTEHRWFTLDELSSWHEMAFPENLGELITSHIAT